MKNSELPVHGVSRCPDLGELRPAPLRRLSELATYYVSDLSTRTSPGYLERARGIARMLNLALADPELSALSIQAVVMFRAKRLQEGASRATVNLEVAFLQTMLRWARDLGMIGEHPALRVRALPVREADQRRRKRALSADEVARLIAAARRLDARASATKLPQTPMWVTFLETGARRGELVAIRWHQIDLDRATLHIAAADSKSGRGRTIPIRRELALELADLRSKSSRFLGRLVGPQDFAFRSPYGVPWIASFNNVGRHLRRVLREAGIERRDEAGRLVTPHALRHTLATRLARANVPPKSTQSILGHSDVRTTLDYYTHVEEQDLRAAIETLGAPSPGAQMVAALERPTASWAS